MLIGTRIYDFELSCTYLITLLHCVSYIFLLFDQSEEFNKQTLVTPSTSFEHFNISAFASAVNLGQPIGGTYMLVAPQV